MFIKWLGQLEDMFLDNLGPLKQLVGLWQGTGFTAIARPDGQPGHIFHIRLNTTNEYLLFIPILGGVQNRGGQNQIDITLHGLMYAQLIVNSQNVTEVLHFETGQWLLVPKTDEPTAGATIVRQATILHGATFIATGNADSFTPQQGAKPNIPDVSIRPSDNDPVYQNPYDNILPPTGISKDAALNPNILLKERIANQTFVSTATIQLAGNVAVSPGGRASPNTPNSDIANIPFLRENAKVTEITSTIYMEIVSEGSTEQFDQLQYTQNCTLAFEGVNWPHVSIATLRQVTAPKRLPELFSSFLSAPITL
jgi:hypothetical protein